MKTPQFLVVSAVLVIFSLTSCVSAWLTPRSMNYNVASSRRRQHQSQPEPTPGMRIMAFPNSEFSPNEEETTADEDAPCSWHDIYTADCAMDTFSARFVAANWVQSLPCAKGMEECDFPDDMRLPGIRPESQQQEINVMEFLNIKRVDAIKNNRNSNQ